MIVLMSLLSLASTQLHFELAGIFDGACAYKQGHELDPAIVREARERLPEFVELWQAQGPALLDTLKEVGGRPHPRRELTVHLTVCNFPSMSSPFFVNLRRYLRSAQADPLPALGVVQITFHEFLHKYLVRVFDYDRSRLLYKNRGESRSVLNHLHLMALEREIYSQLGREDLLELAELTYGLLKNPSYKRIWEMVRDEPELGAALIREVRTLSKP